MKQNLSIVWLKRDLRLQDNEAITNALNSGQHTLLLYVNCPQKVRHYLRVFLWEEKSSIATSLNFAV
ncbi:hypothetical protein DZC78_15685 [Olleya aquimaris]|nr:hypothetical protein DZC78_15685 [Olleya aquimaris]